MKRKSIQSVILTAFLLAWSILFGSFVSISRFIRLMADDFCYLNNFQQFGFWGAQQQIYLTWAGRYADHFLIGLSTFGAPGNAPLISIGLMFVWLIGLWLLCRLILKTARIQNPTFTALVMALIIVAVTILTLPNRFQTIYWVNGSFPYGWPMVFWTWLTWWCWRILRKEHVVKLWEAILAVLTAFISAGLSETAAAVQMALIALACVYFLLFQKQKKKSIFLLAALLLITGIGLVIMALAPGNQVRASQMAQSAGIFTAVGYAFQYGLDFFFYQVRGYLIPLCVTCILAAFLIALVRSNNAIQKDKKPSAGMIIVELGLPTLCTYLVLVALSIPLAYIEGAYPEDRAWGMGAWLIVLLFAYLGGYWGYHLQVWLPRIFLHKRLLLGISFISIAVGLAYPLRAAMNLRPYIQDRQDYAVAYDIRQSQLETAADEGITDLTINALQSQFGVSDLSADPANWANICTAEYFGLTTLTGR
jgi:hypothetical protein